MHVYFVTVMTHVIALEDGQSGQGTFGHITPVSVGRPVIKWVDIMTHVIIDEQRKSLCL